jgi:hypothetical protein
MAGVSEPCALLNTLAAATTKKDRGIMRKMIKIVAELGTPA